MNIRVGQINYKRLAITLVIVAAIVVGLRFIGTLGGNAIAVVNRFTQGTVIANITPEVTPIDKDPEYQMPSNDPNRLDILLLGIRGKDDVENGGLLTDTILLFSLDKITGKAALISIPRDLTVRITDERTKKINSAYAHYGLSVKKLFSRVLGVGIDNVVVVDFEAFHSVVETLGGIDITLAAPFEESQQWAGTASESYVFSLPAGKNHLDGEQALYYVRSRYSTSDFDRSRRQMQVIMAIKEKAGALDLTQDPLKALQVVLAVRKHVETDLNIFDIGTVRNLMEQEGLLGRIKQYHLTTENVLYETKVNGIYELLPLNDTLATIKNFVQGILQ